MILSSTLGTLISLLTQPTLAWTQKTTLPGLIGFCDSLEAAWDGLGRDGFLGQVSEKYSVFHHETSTLKSTAGLNGPPVIQVNSPACIC